RLECVGDRAWPRHAALEFVQEDRTVPLDARIGGLTMASDRDWAKEMAKIDKQLESVSDEAVFPTKAAKTAGVKANIEEKQKSTSTLGVVLRLTLSVALGVGMLFWPYESRCGVGLAGYLAAVT